MISDDQYRDDLAATVIALATWADRIRPVAAVEYGEADGVWRLSVIPRTDGACPFEFGLRADQRYDLVLDDQIYEDQPIEQLAFFEALVRRVSEGQVIKRRHVSSMTTVDLGVEMIVALAPTVTWSRFKNSDEYRPHSHETQIVWLDHHYLPYVRRNTGPL